MRSSLNKPVNHLPKAMSPILLNNLSLHVILSSVDLISHIYDNSQLSCMLFILHIQCVFIDH